MKYVPSTSMPRAWSHTNAGGFSLIEVILASALFALLLTALVGGYLYGQESTVLAGNRARATMLAEEGLEAARNIRDSQFTSNLLVGTYGLSTTTNRWNLVGTSDDTDIFTRNVIISRIGTKRKLVTSTVTWQQNPQRTGSVTLTTYLTHWMSDWRAPLVQSTTDIEGIEDGIKIQVQGDYVYIVRSVGTPNFLIYDISGPASPTLTGSLTLAGNPVNIAVSGNHAYIASGNNTQELQIIDVANPVAPAQVGAYNAVGTVDALGVYVVGTRAYIVKLADNASNELAIVNVANPAAPALLGSLNLAASAFEIWVLGNYAHIVTNTNSQELVVIDVTNPAAPAQVGAYNAVGPTDGITVSGAGNTVLFGQGSAIRIIDVTNPLLPVLLSTFTAAGIVNDISVNFGRDNAYVYYGTVNSTGEFGVFDITTLTAPIAVATIDLTTLNGVAYSTTTDHAYIVGIDDAAEFRVIMPL